MLRVLGVSYYNQKNAIITSENPLRGQARNRMTCCEICLLRLGEEERKRRRWWLQCQRRGRHYEPPIPTTNSYSTLTTSLDPPDFVGPHNSELHHQAYGSQTPNRSHKTLPKLNRQLNGIIVAASSLLAISLLLVPVEPVTSVDRVDRDRKTNIYWQQAPEVRGNHETSRRSNNVRQVGVADHGSGATPNDHMQEAGFKSHLLVAEEAIGDIVPKASDERGEPSPRDNERVSLKSSSSSAAAANKIGEPGERARQRARRSSPLEERGLCADCLAIPVVASATSTIKRQKPVEMDFSTQGPRYFNLQQQPQLRTSPGEQIGAPNSVHISSAISTRRQQQRQLQQTDQDAYATAAIAEVRRHQKGAYQHQTGWLEDDNQRDHQHSVERPIYRKSYAYKHPTTTTTPPPLPFEPKSDEKCPMTGHMTVCAQIGSYPADVILTKLEGAKMMFGQTYFNLDSLFSDESQHSSDPFEADKPAAAGAKNGSTFEKSKHLSREPKTNIDDCAHESESDTHYGRSIRSSRVRGDDTNVNNALGSSQITTPTGATESVAGHWVSRKMRFRQSQLGQRTYDDGSTAADGHFLADSAQIMSGQRKPTSGKRSILQRDRGLGCGPERALLNDSPAQTMKSPRQGPNSLSPFGAGNERALQLAHAPMQAAELVDEFLYLVERRGVRLPAPGQSSGGCHDKPACNLRHPDQGPTKVYQTEASKSNDYVAAAAAEHNDSHVHDQLANYISAPGDTVAATESTITAAISPVRPTAELNSHNMAKGTSALPSKSSAHGDTSGLKMATDPTAMATPQAHTNTTSSGPHKRAAATRRVVGQPYVTAAPSGHVDDRTTSAISRARLRSDKTLRSSSMDNQKRPASRKVAPMAASGPHISAAPRNDASDLEHRHWPAQGQITLATALNEQRQLNAPSQLNKLHELQSKFATRTRRQVPITIDNGNRSSRIDPERLEAAAREPGEQVQPVCAAKSIYISPRAALNEKKQWKFVVNAAERDPRVKQIIRVDICQNPFGPCSDRVSLPLGFTSQCKQKYSKKKLLALDSRSGLLEVDTFFIPSCCVCQLILDSSRPSDPMTPIGEGPPPQPISNADQDDGDPPIPVTSDDGASVGSAP